MTPITVDALLERYDALLIDAYGVLVDSAGAREDAVWLINRLTAEQRPFLILTNDASKLPETTSRRLAAFGMPVPADRIITSGSLLAGYFAQHELHGAPTVVLGTPDSVIYAQRAGGEVIPAAQAADAVVVAVCDEAGYPLLETLDDAATGLVRRFDAGLATHLVLPNPDRLYPKSDGRLGVAAGTLGALLESILEQRYPVDPPRFDRLGKPHKPIFDEAVRRAGTGNLALLGDQLPTDIQGALDYGIDAVLVGGGLTPLDRDWHPEDPRPTWIMERLTAKRGGRG